MSNSIESVTTSTLGLALDAAALRHQAITSNIANVNTPGYQPVQVNFEAQLDAARASLRSDDRIGAHDLAGVRPTLIHQASAGAAPVRLDSEVANMSQNLVQYQTLIKILNRHMSILATAASDGKR